MFYFLQNVLYKPTGEVLVYKGVREGIHFFGTKNNDIEMKDSDFLENDFEELFEEVIIFGKTKIKRLKRGALTVENLTKNI